MNLRSLLLAVFLLGTGQLLQSQEIQYLPKEYIAPDGTIYWNKNLPLYIRVSPYADGQGTLLKTDNKSQSNPIYLDTEGVNYIRTKYAVNNETKKIIDPLQEVMMPIVADGIGPATTIQFSNAESSRSDGNQYYGPGLTVSLSASDKYAGVEQTQYSISTDAFSFYSNEIKFPNQGEHTIQYYSVDNVGNKEETKSKTFIVDIVSPNVTHNVNGSADDNVIATVSKIYFTATDDLSGVHKVMFRFDDENYKTYNGSKVPFDYLSDGNHVLEYYAVDKVGNQTGIYRYEFYYDKTAPLTASDILGDRFVVGKKIYFSGRTKMKLTAVDNKIGVKNIMYAIDDGKFEEYDQPFYLPSIPGQHTIKFYSQDRLSNRPTGSERYKHTVSLVFLDLTGPDIDFKLSGPKFNTAGTQFISPRTEVVMTGRDRESGLQYMSYSIDGATAETNFVEGFTIATSGEHKIEFFAYDNVNNRNIGGTTVFVDASPPNIYETFSTNSFIQKEGLPVHPAYTQLFLSATDDIVGNDKIYYRLNDGKERLYNGPISNLSKNRKYKISVRAIDKVGNESTKEVNFMTGEK